VTAGAGATSKRLELIEQLIAKGSVDPFVHYGRAMELRSLGRLEDALAAFGGVATRFAAYVPTYLMAAQVARELGRVDEARAFAARGLEAAKTAGDSHTASEIEAFVGMLDA